MNILGKNNPNWSGKYPQEKICLQCNKPFLVTTSGNLKKQKTCSHSCGMIYAKRFEEKHMTRCVVCQKEFRVKLSKLKERKTCSYACMAEMYKKRMVGVSNPNYKNAGQKICERCGLPFQSYNKSRKFCSHDCYYPNKKEYKCQSCGITTTNRRKFCRACERTGSHPCQECGFQINKKRKLCVVCRIKKISRAKIRVRCPICYKEFKTSRVRPDKHCSRECYGKTMSMRQRGAGSHFWKNGATDEKMRIRTHPLYQQWRTKVFKRDNFTCQSCMKPSSELKGERLCAHHIIAFKDDARKALKVSNGITLCWPCHKDFHRYVSHIEMVEANLQKKANEYFKTEPGVWMMKIHGGPFQASGVPDFLGCICGIMVGIELKCFPNFATPLQRCVMQKMNASGAKVFVCRSMDEIKRAVKLVKEIA